MSENPRRDRVVDAQFMAEFALEVDLQDLSLLLDTTHRTFHPSIRGTVVRGGLSENCGRWAVRCNIAEKVYQRLFAI